MGENQNEDLAHDDNDSLLIRTLIVYCNLGSVAGRNFNGTVVSLAEVTRLILRQAVLGKQVAICGLLQRYASDSNIKVLNIKIAKNIMNSQKGWV